MYEQKTFLAWLKAQNSRDVNICSICTGAFFLAEAGVLDQRTCTTHWKFIPELKNRFPSAEVADKRLFVVDKNLYTSAGVSSGIDLSLFIVENLYGSKFATDLAQEIVIYFRRSESDPQLSIYLEYRNHIDDRVHKAQDFLVNNISKEFNLNDLAEHVYMSSRNLTRLFKKTTGITIGAYIEKLRIERAVLLLADHHKVDHVARKCGLKSTNQLRALLKKHSSVLPGNFSEIA